MRTEALFFSLSLVCLGACAAGPKPEVTAAQSVCAAAYGDPALDPIRGRIPFADDAATKAAMSYLSDTGRPTAIERQALLQLDSANRRCWDAWDRVGTSPHINQARVEVSSALAQLYRGETSYGDYNRQRSEALARMQAALQQEDELRRYGGGGGRFSIGFGMGFWR